MVAKIPQEIEERAFERSSNRMDYSEVAPLQHDMFSSVQFGEAGFSTDSSHDRASTSKERQRFGRARKHIQTRKTQETAGEMRRIEKRTEASDKSVRRHPPLLPSKSDMEAHLSTKTPAQGIVGRNRVSNEDITSEGSTSNSNLLSDPKLKESSRDFNSFASGLQGELREDSDSSTSQFLKLLGSDKSGELPRLPPSDQKKRVAVLSDNFIESLAGSFNETTGSKERLSITQVHRQLRTKDDYPPDSLIEALTKASCAPAQETQRRQEQIHSDGLESLEPATEAQDLNCSSSSLRRSISSPSPRQQWSLNPMRVSWNEKIPRSTSTDSSLPICEPKLSRKQSKSRRKRGDKTYFDC